MGLACGADTAGLIWASDLTGASTFAREVFYRHFRQPPTAGELFRLIPSPYYSGGRPYSRASAMRCVHRDPPMVRPPRT
jgi:hypothetical protein